VEDGRTDPRYGRAGMAQNALIVMAMTVLSGLLGLLRESVIAHQFGTGDDYAAYVAAFRLPDLIYLLVIGGALGSAFIPVFTAYLARRDDAGAWKLAGAVLHLALLAALLLASLVFFLAPYLVRWVIAPGYPEAQQALTVRLTRLLLLQPVLLGVGGLAMAVLNAFRRFLLTSLAPLVYNLSIIAGAAFLGPYWGIDGLVAGVLLGAALYLPVLLPGLWLCRARYVFSLDWREEGVREVGRLLLPRVLGQLAFQVNFVVITALASFPGSLAVTAINYAYRLLGFPLAILGVSLGTVVFPTLAALANQGDMEDFRRTLSRMVRVVLFLALPAAALLLVLRFPLLRLLFERGEFGPESTAATAQAFLFFALGLPAACVTEILLRAFYALHDTRTPVAVGAAVVALNVALGAGLLQGIGFAGLALSFSFTNSLETAALFLLLRRRIRRVGGRAILRSGLRSLAAALPAAGTAALFLWGGERTIPASGAAAQVLLLGLPAVLGAGLYLGLALLLGSPEMGEAWALLRRRISSPERPGT